MKDLGYLEDAVALIGNIFTHEYFGPIQPIPLEREQNDTLSPYLYS